MFKYIILCLCASLCGVLCDLNKEEGADCDWEGVKGKCVEETRCMTALDTESPKQPVCSKKGDVTIICCTDCELVNDTRNFVIIPTGMFWKDGRGKARDHCLQYIRDLPYQCHQSYYSKIIRTLNEEKSCHRYSLSGVGGPPALGLKPPTEYPHQVLLGFTDAVKPDEPTQWLAGGSIISDRFILTAAHTDNPLTGKPLYVAANVQNRSDSTLWQTHKVKRFIPHPEYRRPVKYHDIALIETETPIQFNENVLPACLHVDNKANDDKAVATTWRDVSNREFNKFLDTIQKMQLEEFSEADCKSYYRPHRLFKQGYDHSTQMCYGNKEDPAQACMGFSGEPLLIDTQFSHCVHTVIGVTSFGSSCGPRATKPDVQTRVSYYVPWIESVVWP